MCKFEWQLRDNGGPKEWRLVGKRGLDSGVSETLRDKQEFSEYRCIVFAQWLSLLDRPTISVNLVLIYEFQ